MGKVVGILPAPLKGTDSDPFTRATLSVRIPQIIEQVYNMNPQLPDSVVSELKSLRSSLIEDAVVTPLAADQPEPRWNDFMKPYVGKERYTEIPWFVVENYVYKRILDATRQWDPSFDPFLVSKKESLLLGLDSFQKSVLPLLSEGANQVDLCLLRSLWGNRADLSLSGGKTAEMKLSHGSETLIADDTASFFELIKNNRENLQNGKKRITIVLDNCGLELLADLAFADSLLSTGCIPSVRFMCKTSPVFVSDALVSDVDYHISAIRNIGLKESSLLYDRLTSYLASGQLVLESHEFFTSPLPLWEAPDDLLIDFDDDLIVIFKGDANYRRVLGDLHWKHDESFAEITSYFLPRRLICLRTCKAGIVTGLKQAVIEKVTSVDPSDWLTSGKYGLIQMN